MFKIYYKTTPLNGSPTFIVEAATVADTVKKMEAIHHEGSYRNKNIFLRVEEDDFGIHLRCRNTFCHMFSELVESCDKTDEQTHMSSAMREELLKVKRRNDSKVLVG